MADTAIDFSEILGQKVGNSPVPKPLPDGTYSGTIKGLATPRLQRTKEGDRPIITFTFELNEPHDDVDADDLEAAGGLLLHNGQPKTIKQEYWKDQTAETGWSWQLDGFLAGFGYDESSGKSYTEAFEDLDGKDVIIALKQRSYTANGQTRTVNDIVRVVAAD